MPTTNDELKIGYVEEFTRLQSYMLACDESSPAYTLMLDRYHTIKAILESMSFNLTNIDKVNK